MIHLLQPLFLLALFALSVPLLIHLLSRKEGKTIKVGSIRYLRTSESHRFRRLKLSEIPLLLLRLALLTMLVLLLAGPVWLSSSNANNEDRNGWVLVSPELLRNPIDVPALKMIDSLVSSGNELRLFAPGLQLFSLDDSLTPGLSSDNYWSLIREAEHRAPGNCRFWVFTPNRLAAFRGARPSLRSDVDWYTPAVFAQNRWIDEAVVLPHDSLKIVIGFSDSSRTMFRESITKLPKTRMVLSDDGMAPVEFLPANQKSWPALRLLEEDAVVEDNLKQANARNELEVLILHDDSRRDDAHYVRSSISAVFDFAHVGGSVQERPVEDPFRESDEFDWIIWLAATAVPDSIMSRLDLGTTVLTDAQSDYRETTGPVVTNLNQRMEGPSLFRRTPWQGSGVALWNDGYGEPVLAFQRKRNGIHLQFYSRFHPDWTDLVLRPEFPELMLGLLEFVNNATVSGDAIPGRSDQRRIAASQFLPVQETSIAGLEKSANRSLHLPLWLLATGLFIVERVVSGTRQA